MKKNEPPILDDLLALTVCEIRRLLWRLLWKLTPEPNFVLAWSRWRRRHQLRAKHAHYRQRLASLP